MQSKSKSNDRGQGQNESEPNILGRIAACINTPIINFIIEKEIDEEVFRARRESWLRETCVQKTNQLANSKSCTQTKPRKNKKNSQKQLKPAQELPKKRLPKLLTTEGLVNHKKEKSNFFDSIKAELSEAITAARRLLMPTQRELHLEAKLKLATLEERISACKKIIYDIPKKQLDFSSKLRRASQEGQKPAKREGKLGKHKALNRKKLSEENERAINLERTLTQYKKLDRLRLPLLKNRLEKLKLKAEIFEKQIVEDEPTFLAETIKFNAARADAIMLKTKFSANARNEAIDRAEQQVLALEAQVLATQNNPNFILEFAPELIEQFEKKVQANEQIAKDSIEAIAKLPPLEPNSMTAEQAKKTLTEYSKAINEITTVCQHLTEEETKAMEVIAKTLATAEKWQERQSMAESQENLSLAKQAELRATSQLRRISKLEESANLIKSAKDSIQKQLEDMNFACEKLTERLHELSEEQGKKDKETEKKLEQK
ncbi:hypothetical protein BH11CYA1_BH11CYA1_50000 [soil metagenome]